MKLTLGISPCPNDTFIFAALINNWVNTNGISFEVSYQDVEALNKAALQQQYDVTKFSFALLTQIEAHYSLLDSGAALGHSCGPILVAKQPMEVNEILSKSIAIPGKHTTANFLLNFYAPSANNRTEVLFSNIENEVIDGKYDCGLLIHENRFTFQDKGLVKIADLGEFWEQQTGFPIPLGGIAVNKRIEEDVALQVNTLIKESIEYAYANKEQVLDFVAQYAQEMNRDVMLQHIKLYVNDYSLSLGDKGVKAIFKMRKELRNVN